METQSPQSELSPGYSSNASGKRKRDTETGVREHGLMRDMGEDAARFVGSSSGIHFIRNVHQRLMRRSANHATEYTGTSTELVPGEDDQLRRRRTSTESTSLWKDSEVCNTMEDIPFESLVKWSESYFESWHPFMPFLDGPDVLRIFEDVSQKGLDRLNHLDRSILRSVLSISIADHRQGVPLTDPVPAELLFRSIDEAVNCSQFALCQPPSVRTAQAALSIQLFLISMLCLNAASRLGGLIVRMAFHLGLHRCPTRYPFFTPEETAQRRRVFWCIYSQERFLSQSLGIPLDIQDDDIDVCYPGEEVHGAGEKEDKRLQLLVFSAKHAKIRGLILELRNKNMWRRRDTMDHAIHVQTELAKWSNETQDLVEEDELSEDKPTPSHRLVILISKYESIIALNRPMMASDPSSPPWASAMQACISAAKSICIALRRHACQNQSIDGQDARLRIPMLWPSFTWASWISAFVLAYAAFEHQMPLDSALRHIEWSKEALRHIATRNTSWPEYCLSAIDELVSEVKEVKEPSSTDSVSTRLGGPMGNLQARRSMTNNMTSDGLMDELQTRHHEESYSRFSPAMVATDKDPGPWQSPNFRGDSNVYSRWPQPSWQPSEAPVEPMDFAGVPTEGQESMGWYDQLFASSFSAVENPFLAGAQFDPSSDPTWSYMR